jgi:hypothetical protein
LPLAAGQLRERQGTHGKHSVDEHFGHDAVYLQVSLCRAKPALEPTHCRGELPPLVVMSQVRGSVRQSHVEHLKGDVVLGPGERELASRTAEKNEHTLIARAPYPAGTTRPTPPFGALSAHVRNGPSSHMILPCVFSTHMHPYQRIKRHACIDLCRIMVRVRRHCTAHQRRPCPPTPLVLGVDSTHRSRSPAPTRAPRPLAPR